MNQPVSPPVSDSLSRRDFLKITAVSAAAVAAGYFLGRETLHSLAVYRESRLLMGTMVQLAAVDSRRATAAAAVAAAFAEMERLIDILDHRRPATPLGQLNRVGYLADAPAELIAVIETAVTYGRLTNGAFDISVKPLLDHIKAGGAPAAFDRRLVDYRQIDLSGRAVRLGRPGMALTLDGLGKGYVVDKGAAALRSQGYANILVEAGGDLVGGGRRPDGAPWQIGVAHPRQATIIAQLPIQNQAAATSGDYQHYFSADFSQHHIIDPRAGESPPELASVTVTAPTAVDADALSTSLLALGLADGLSLANRLPHVSALLITKSLTIHRSG